MAVAGKTPAEEAAELVESLPPDKARSVLDFATYLADRANEEDWDRVSAKAAESEAFKALAEDVKRRHRVGKSEPLDPSKL